jgi:hypothetical protein
MAAKTNKERALDAEVRCSRWLADGNEAKERGNGEKAEVCYARAQYWLDRYNKLTGAA